MKPNVAMNQKNVGMQAGMPQDRPNGHGPAMGPGAKGPKMGMGRPQLKNQKATIKRLLGYITKDYKVPFICVLVSI